MITALDVANILYHDCGVFNMERVPYGRTLVGKITNERITIHPHEQQPEAIWVKNYVEINLCVPDIDNEADTIRLNELQRQCAQVFNIAGGGIVGRYDDTQYLYTIEVIGQEQEDNLKCHYINCKILFQVLNIN